MKSFIAFVAAAALVLVLAACGQPAPERQSIAATAAELGDFDTLLAALTEAELAGTFAADDTGPFTVFAPTDAAFADLLAALELTPAELLASEDLETILTYHVLAGRFAPTSLVDAGSEATLAGLPLCFGADAGALVVNDSSVVAGPVQATNGVIYAIDAVLNPFDSIAGTAIAADDFEVLVAAVIAADLVEPLVCGGPFTVFAPTDEAFVALLEALDVTAEDLLADVDLVTQVLLYHVVPGTLLAEDVLDAVADGDGSVDVVTLQGEAITVTAPEGVVLNGDVNVIATDVTARNGVIHVIDAVLLPSLD